MLIPGEDRSRIITISGNILPAVFNYNNNNNNQMDSGGGGGR